MCERAVMQTETGILLVGGAPRVPIDAIRSLMVTASGATATCLQDILRAGGLTSELLLSVSCQPARDCARFEHRADLDQQVRAWAAAHPKGLIVLSAAVNDYQLRSTTFVRQGHSMQVALDGKLPSGAEWVQITLEPAPKLVDTLRQEWAFAGRLIAFKFEQRDTVLAAASALRRRIAAELVVANSLCGQIQALVDQRGCWQASDRGALLAELAKRILSGEGGGG